MYISKCVYVCVCVRVCVELNVIVFLNVYVDILVWGGLNDESELLYVSDFSFCVPDSHVNHELHGSRYHGDERHS